MRVTSEVRTFRLKTLIAGSVLALAVTAAPAAAAIIPLYSQNFDAPLGAEWTGTTTLAVVPVGFAGLGFSGGMLHNSVAPPVATTLTLTGLAAHDAVDINFLLAIIDSWDGIGGSPGPDTFVVRVDGVDRFSEVFAIQSGSNSAGVPPDLGPSPCPCPSLGFNASFGDRAFNMGNVGALSFAHSASSLTISFFTLAPGWQGATDESWGIDNLSIDLITREDGPTTPAVPEPATLSLVGLALLGGASRIRRKIS